MNVEVGGGTKPLTGYHNLDPAHGTGIWRRRFQDGIPADDGTVDAIYASHVMEHIPAGDERIRCMNEAWRALRSGGTFYIRVPLFPSWQAVADPTHVSFWTEQSFGYFTRKMQHADYGIRYWLPGSFHVEHGWEGHCRLVKP